jgi:hypothetical protein
MVRLVRAHPSSSGNAPGFRACDPGLGWQTRVTLPSYYVVARKLSGGARGRLDR